MIPDPDSHEKVPEKVPSATDTDIDIGRMEKRDHIGSGGTADVFKKVTADGGDIVAVKQPRFEGTMSEEVAEKFVFEAKTWENLGDLDGIVDVVDWGTSPVPWIALEYMDGGTLSNRFVETGTPESLWIGVRIADAVWQAHRRGVPHLGLKPDNILFRETETGFWDFPKVSDWGLAKVRLHHSESVDGLSPTYSAPEQFDPDTFESPDDATDIYQLGTIVYELLTGEPLFSGQAATVMNRHLTEDPVLPTGIDSTLAGEVDDVLGTALAKRKVDRYESMLDFRRDLDALFRKATSGECISLVCDKQGSDSQSPEPDSQTSDRQTRQGRESRQNEGTRDFSDGSSFDTDDDRTGVLENVREQSQSGEEKRFPWQHRDEAPGLDETVSGTLNGETSSSISPSDIRTADTDATDALSDESAADTEKGLSSLFAAILKSIFR